MMTKKTLTMAMQSESKYPSIACVYILIDADYFFVRLSNTSAAAATSNADKAKLSGMASQFAAMRQQQFEALQWSQFFDDQEIVFESTPIFTAGNKGQILFCLHAAGSSAMSFAALAEKLKDTVTVVAFDQRGHGQHMVRENDNCLAED